MKTLRQSLQGLHILHQQFDVSQELYRRMCLCLSRVAYLGSGYIEEDDEN